MMFMEGSESGGKDAVNLAPNEKQPDVFKFMEQARALLAQLAAIPWLALGAIGTGSGIALLYFYFSSIDFIPADIPSILGASLLVAMLALVFFVSVVATLIAPLWAYRSAGLDDWNQSGDMPAGRISKVSGLWSLQVLGAGGLLLFLEYRQWRECSPSPGIFGVTGAVLALVGSLGWAWHEIKTTGLSARWWSRLHLVAWVCLLAGLPVVSLFLLLIPSHGADWLHLGVFFGVWLLVVVGSSTFLDRIPLWGCALAITVLSPILLFSIPAVQGRPGLLPAMVAELAGIRSKKTNELRVPKSTCSLIQSTLGGDPAVACGDAEWSTVHAQVLSNLGDRWLIELKPDGPDAVGAQGPLRLTIPGAGVQTVRRASVTSTQGSTTDCRV